ncbi:DUF5683 domain-containing protein [Mucilaginibacter agri]|uniref:DUF5683 domain-containing protein n=1 Tax=Mucilaginibacter agri TaxID=2695265 RepID=A0A965ZGM2_9SPHI|nr:DUF5683 domain-containing protein [Mucilaginibacter agri]NCD70698.1 hypothetical protein [Mucilaginibacter agri]
MNFIGFTAKAQHDSPANTIDSVSVNMRTRMNNQDKPNFPDNSHSPHKAWVRSAILPGLGQVYNGQWWKVPFIYTGFGLLIKSMVDNRNNYHLYYNEAEARLNGTTRNPKFKGFSGGYNDFINAANNADRNFQISVLGFVAVWGINCVDAYISAKFIHSYSVDNNLSFKVSPSTITQPAYAVNNSSPIAPGLKLSLTL